MDARTARHLGRLTRGFYDRSAAGFVAGSRLPWPGWGRVLDALAGQLDGLERVRILDLGCGNGRFAGLAAERLGPGIRYLGLDASPALVARAEALHRQLPGARFEVCDLLAGEPEDLLPPGLFDLVVLFGLLHHLPTFARRRRLVEVLARRLAPGGGLALSTWSKPGDGSLGRRVLPWDEHARASGVPFDPAEVKPGDYLIVRPGHGARYCHFLDDRELGRLLDGTGLAPVARFRADGRQANLNRYQVVRRPAG